MATCHRRVVLDVTDVVASEREFPLAIRTSGVSIMAKCIHSSSRAATVTTDSLQ